jgi:rhodanese-related sulfurtransferase
MMTCDTIKSFKEWLMIEENKETSEISIEETHRFIQNGDRIVLLDVREKKEIALGYIKGAIFIPMDKLKEEVETSIPEKDAPVVIYCAAGIRSLAAAKILNGMGYSHVFSMAKGIDGWKAAGYEIVTDSELTQDQLNRYSRHILLKEVGIEGQVHLLRAKVLLVGAGEGWVVHLDFILRLQV